MNIYIHTKEIRNIFNRTARSLLLAYLLLYLMTFWHAETVYAKRIAFQRGCAETGGFITVSDGETSCTRVRPIHGLFQL